MKKIALLLLPIIIGLGLLACRYSPELPDLEEWMPQEENSAAPIATLAPVQVKEQAPPQTDGDQEIGEQHVEAPQRPPPPEVEDLRQFDAALTALYEYASPGVVAILTLSEAGGGLGSGFVYDKQGHIITNYHVIELAEDLEVDFPSGIKVRGQVVGTDLDSDLAVIKVDVPEEYLNPLTLGNSDLLKVGQTVYAIGNPFGLSGTITMGIVSAKGRTLESMHQTESGDFFSAGDIIQTDASINPGNSGGPLLNLNGEVIGINRAIRTTGLTAMGEPINSGIGFAVSVNIVKRVVPMLIENGTYDYPYVGISAREELSLIEQEALGLTHSTGAYVVEVVTGGPADQAGVIGGTAPSSIAGLPAGGDLIIGVDGQEVRIFGEFLSYLMTNKQPGDTITIKVIRSGQELDIPITLEGRQ